MNDDFEIIKLSCNRCRKSVEGTYDELYGDLGSVVPFEAECDCGGIVSLKFTGKYR